MMSVHLLQLSQLQLLWEGCPLVELLSFPNSSIFPEQSGQLTEEYLGARKFHNRFVAQVAPYDSPTLEFTERLSATHSFTNVCQTVCLI